MLKTTLTLAAAVAALFPTSEKAISEKLTQEEFNAFAAETQEVQNRLDAQADGNQAVATDLTQAQTDLATAQTALTIAQTELATANTSLATANQTITTLTPKATAWDAHKAALNQSGMSGDSTNGKPANEAPKDSARETKMREMKAKHPRMMEGIEVAADE